MSTIINALTNEVVFNDASTDNLHFNLTQGEGSPYHIGLHNQNTVDGGSSGVNAMLGTTSSADAPSLQNLAPELIDASINRLKFIVLGVIGSMLAILGFLGNTMSMVVLQQRQMRSSTSYYLLSLAIYDNLIVLSMLLYFIIPALAINIPFMRNYLATYSITEPIGYPLSLTAQMGSIYTCVGFTVERFIAVCRPLQVANTCTKSRTIRAIVLIFIWSVIYNIPRFFHLQAVFFYQDAMPSGGSESKSEGTTANFLTNLVPPSSHHQIDNRFSLHQNASSSHIPLPQLSFHATITPAIPCISDGRFSQTSETDSFYHGITAPCVNKDDNYKNEITSSSKSSMAQPLSFSLLSSSSSSLFSSFLRQPSTSLSSYLRSPALSSSSNVLSSKSSSLPSPTTTTETTAAFTSSSASTVSESSSIERPPNNRAVKHIKALPTDFGSDPVFRNIYLIYSQLFFMFLLPFLIILFMNIGLIRAVKRSKAMQQTMGTSASARKERNLTVMLIAVIVVFLVCQFPTIIDNILIAVFGAPRLYPNYQYQCFYTACTLMVLVNSASNFLLYCFFGKKFRVVFLSLLGIKKRQQYVAYRSTMYRSRSNGSRGCDVEMSVV